MAEHGKTGKLYIWLVYDTSVVACKHPDPLPVLERLRVCQVSRMRWPSTVRGRNPASRPAARPGGLPPHIVSGMTAVGISSALPGPVHDGMPVAPGVAGRFLSGPINVPAGPTMFSAIGMQHNGRLVGSMQGASSDCLVYK